MFSPGHLELSYGDRFIELGKNLRNWPEIWGLCSKCLWDQKNCTKLIKTVGLRKPLLAPPSSYAGLPWRQGSLQFDMDTNNQNMGLMCSQLSSQVIGMDLSMTSCYININTKLISNTNSWCYKTHHWHISISLFILHLILVIEQTGFR